MSTPKERLQFNFSRAAVSYDDNTALQYDIGKRLLQQLPTGFSPNKILDIGCGSGKLTNKISKLYPKAKITAFDIADGMIDFATKNYSSPNIIYQKLDGEDNWPGNSYQLIFSNASFQWFNNLETIFKKSQDALEKNGLFVFTLFLSDTFNELKTIFKKNGDVSFPQKLPTKEKLAQLIQTSGMKIEYSEIIKSPVRYSGLLDFMKKQRLTGSLSIEENSLKYQDVLKVIKNTDNDNNELTLHFEYGNYILRNS